MKRKTVEELRKEYVTRTTKTTKHVRDKPVYKPEEVIEKAKKTISPLSEDVLSNLDCSDHFEQRAHERFGLKVLPDKEADKAYVKEWAIRLLRESGLVEESAKAGCIFKARSIIIITSLKKDVLVTCYPISYDTVGKQDLTTQATVKEHLNSLDGLSKDLILSLFDKAYYKTVRDKAKEISKIYDRLAKIWGSLAGDKHSSTIDAKMIETKKLEVDKTSDLTLLFNFKDTVQDLKNKLED